MARTKHTSRPVELDHTVVPSDVYTADFSAASSSFPTSLPTTSPSTSCPPNPLSLLPVALVPLVCVYLTPSEKSSLWSRLCRSHRSQLTGACFVQDHLQLTPAVLDSLRASPYLANLLSSCLSLTIRLSFNEPVPATYSDHIIELFTPQLPPQPEPDPATHPPPPPPPFPFPHLTHLSLHEDSDLGVLPVVLGHPSFPSTLRQLHVCYRSYNVPLPPFVAARFPVLEELSLPSTVSTSNVRAVLRLPALRVLDMSQASVLNGLGQDEDELDAGWVNAVRAAGGVGQQLEVLLMPRGGGGQIDEVLKLMHSQVKVELSDIVPQPTADEKKAEEADGEVKEGEKEQKVDKAEVEVRDLQKEETEEVAGDEKEGTEEHETKDEQGEQKVALTTSTKSAKKKRQSKKDWAIELIRKANAILAREEKEREEKQQRELEEKAAAEMAPAAVDAEFSDFAELVGAVSAAAEAEASAQEQTERPVAVEDMEMLLQPIPPIRRADPPFHELQVRQKAEEEVVEQLKRAATPPASANGRRKRPIPLPSRVRYLSLSGQLTIAGIHSLSRLPQLHTLLFDYYQMSSIGDVFESFVELTKDSFKQLRVLRLSDWSDEQVAPNRRQRRQNRKLATERVNTMLSQLTQLDCLDLRFPPTCEVVSCMPALFQMRNLRKLSLVDAQSTRGARDDAADQEEYDWRDEWTVGATPSLPNLVELCLSSMWVDEECILSIMANAPSLLDVSMLHSPEVTVATLHALSRHCPGLRFLDVDGCVGLALTGDAWEMGRERYEEWLTKQPNIMASSLSTTTVFPPPSPLPSNTFASPSLSSCDPSPPSISSPLTFPALQFLFLTLPYDMDTDFVNLDTHGLQRLVDVLSSSPITHANLSSEHLTSQHVALFERWSQLRSLNLVTSGYGSQPRMAKTMLDYDGKPNAEDGQQVDEEEDDEDEDDEDGEDEDEDEEGDGDEDEKECKEKGAGEPTDEVKDEGDVGQEKAVKSDVIDMDFGGKDEKVEVDVKADNGQEQAATETGKKLKSRKKRKSKVAAASKEATDETTTGGDEKADEVKEDTNDERKEKKKQSANTIATSSKVLYPDLPELYIYSRQAKRSPVEQAAHDRSVTTHSHLHTRPRSLLDLHMLRYEGGDGDDSGTLVFGRVFREESVHDGMAGREAFFRDLRAQLERDRKRSESDLWVSKGRARGRRRRRGGFGNFGR